MSRLWPLLGWLILIASVIGNLIRRNEDPVAAWLKANGLYGPVIGGGCLFVTLMLLLLFIQMQRTHRLRSDRDRRRRNPIHANQTSRKGTRPSCDY